MQALIDSYLLEIEKIQKRGSVWVRGANGWYHSYYPALIKLKISMLKDAIEGFKLKIT